MQLLAALMLLVSPAFAAPGSISLEDAVRRLPERFQKTDFFANAERRDATAVESAAIVAVRDQNGLSCAGFLVTNAAGEPLVATARHCARYHFADDCAAGKIAVVTAAGSVHGSCAGIVVEGEPDDMVVFKAALEGPLPREAKTFSLSAVEAPQGSPLMMIGYPADEQRRGALTITEGCWVNEGPPVDERLTQDEKDLLARSAANARAAAPEVYDAFMNEAQRIFAAVPKQPFNCSVYGGNSGGPVLIPGWPAVVGMPASYYPGITRVLPSDTTSRFYTMASFVKNNRPRLEAAGIAIVDAAPPAQARR